MKSSKFNFYKNAKFFLCAIALILLAGLIVGVTFGLNLVEALGGSVIVYFTLLTFIIMILALVYFTVRYDFVSAFCFVCSMFLNICLVVALCAIIRIPVGDSFIAVLATTIALTCVLCLVVFSNIIKQKQEKLNRDQMVNNVVSLSFKSLVTICLAIWGTILLTLLIVDAEIVMFVRPMIVALVVCFVSSTFVIAPIWGFFYSNRTKKYKVVDETVYVEDEKLDSNEIAENNSENI